MFPARNISVGARADRRPARRGMIERFFFGAQRGGSQGGEIFLSPPSCASLELSSHKRRKRSSRNDRKRNKKTSKSADLPEMGNAKETDCHSPLRGFAMTDAGNANRREKELPINDRRCENSVHSLHVSARSIGDRTQVSRTKHFIRSAGRSASCAAADDRKRKLSARRGVDRKAGRFLSPRLRVLLWSFLPTREESGVP